jgi:hypothetical protein
MTDIRVTGIELIDTDQDPDAGSKVYARFSCLVGPVFIAGVALRRLPDGTVVVSMPACKTTSNRIAINESRVRDRMVEAALSAFTSLGGVMPPAREASTPTDAIALRGAA